MVGFMCGGDCAEGNGSGRVSCRNCFSCVTSTFIFIFYKLDTFARTEQGESKMSFRDRLYELTTPEEVDSFLSVNPNCALFKAGGCHKTMQGFGVVEKMMGSRGELPVGLVKVIDHRPASNHIAELTGI